MKGKLKGNCKLIVGIIIGVIIATIGVKAATTTKDILYDNTNSNLTSTDMQGAIDELNTKANALSSSKPCRVIKGTGRNTNDEIKCGTEEFYVLHTSGDSVSVLTKYPIEAGHASYNASGHEMVDIIEIENPSYAQNKNCGSEKLRCGGTGFSSRYKGVLTKIGLSSDIEVIKPSLAELNKAGCNFVIPPSLYTSTDLGSCAALSWLSGVVVTDTIQGPNTYAIAKSNGLDSVGQINPPHYGEDMYEKLIVRIPVKNIFM